MSQDPIVCPLWDQDIPPGQEAAFVATLQKVHKEILSEVSASVPRSRSFRNWHQKLFHAFVPLPCYAGKFRGWQGYRCLQTNVHVGPAAGLAYQDVPQEMVNYFDQLAAEIRLLEVKWSGMSQIDRVTTVARIVGTAVGHFIRVHPFLNGNGRTSRVLWAALLHRFGLPPHVRLVPRPAEPYSSIMAAAMTGNYAPVQFYVLRALAAGAAPPSTLPMPTQAAG